MYPRDSHGNASPYGECSTNIPTKLHVIYANEVRLSLGVAVIERDGVEVGVRLLLFHILAVCL